jgi:hypothetical protein
MLDQKYKGQLNGDCKEADGRSASADTAIGLLKRPIPSGLIGVLKSAADSTRINAVSRDVGGAGTFWVKRRKRGSGPIIAFANLFFRLAGNPVRVLARSDSWQRWEIECFRLLNGDRFRAFADGTRTVRLERIPGVSMCDLLTEQKLTGAIIEAAARELARAHAIRIEQLRGPWSHADARLANFIYDENEGRARLIDFEVIHTGALSPDERHADDLLVFLQDLMGRLPDERWLPEALRFAGAYGRPEVIAALKKRLVVPNRGVPRLWWGIRTRHLPYAELTRRVGSLRENLP